MCIFFWGTYRSTNGKLVVWNFFGVPLSNNPFHKEIPEIQTAGLQTNNLSFMNRISTCDLGYVSPIHGLVFPCPSMVPGLHHFLLVIRPVSESLVIFCFSLAC